jgi:hypothetical protein
MPNIQLQTGKTIYVSSYEYYILLEEKDVDEFFRNCMADDLGIYIEDPFSNRASKGTLDIEDSPEIEELEQLPEEEFL